MPGGFAAPLGDASAAKNMKELSTEQEFGHEKEKEIFEGVELMRRVMDNLLDWWNHILQIRHGAPYDDDADSAQFDGMADTPQASDDGCTALQLDTFVGLDVLDRAVAEFDTLIGGAIAQLREIKKREKGTKNVRFVIAMFVDACRLRREKIQNTISARQLSEHKRGIGSALLLKDLHNENEIKKLHDSNVHLSNMLTTVRQEKAPTIFTRSLQESLAECIETKLQLNETQQNLLQARSGQPADVNVPALRILKERWMALKKFSIYSLYQEFQQRPSGRKSFNSDEELLTYLAHSSDAKIDQIINADRDKIVSRDALIPHLCYDILLENAELRKMCNTYQLKVLTLRQKGGGAALVR